MAEEEYIEEEVPLTAEELFEQHKAEIDAAFEEKGFFRRLSEMFAGLSKPKNTAEYKLARTELQRLAAPILGIMLPIGGFIVIAVVTFVTGGPKETITVDIASAVEEEAPLEEEQEQEIEEPPPPDETVDIQVDTPVVGPVSDMVSPAPPTNEPLSVKPATEDSVAIIKSPVTMRSMTGSRSPGSIGRMTRGGAGYGDATTEAAVLKALRWLKKTQKSEGCWDGNPISNTALAILAFLAHGETPASKEFGNTVERAIEYLINNQKMGQRGATFNHVDGNEYATLIATYALGEAYGMTKNPNAKQAALYAMERIVKNQSPTGGWDYKLNKDSTRDDMSYAGWALQALKACKMAGLHPEGLDECIKKAIKCLKTRNFKNGGFNYTAGGNPTGLTATGCLAMQLLGYMNEQEVKSALDFMREWKPAFEAKGGASAGGSLPGSCPQYYCYYASQCKYQAGMCAGAIPANVKIWQDWNVAMKALYPKSMLDGGTIEGVDGKPKACGYWKNKDVHGSGDTMATCLCALQLMVYYRYLPTTQTKAAKVEGDDASAADTKKAKKAEVAVEVDI